MHSAFEDVIKNLEEKNKQIERNIEKLEQSCKDEEKKHWQRVADLQRKNQVRIMIMNVIKTLLIKSCHSLATEFYEI